MEKISWTDRVQNKELLDRVKDKIMLHTIERRKTKWIGHVLRSKCFLKHVIERKVYGSLIVTGRRERRRKQLLDDFKETRGYQEVTGAALDCTLWRTSCGKAYGRIVRWTIK
jgi:hypothetical protein